MKKNVEESLRVADLVESEEQQCYGNAFHVVQEVEGYCQAIYVEGTVVNEIGLPFDHGWVEKDGEIIDPTLSEDSLTYFPGLRYPGVKGLAEAIQLPKEPELDDLPFFFRFGPGGMRSPEFCQARNEAIAYSESLLMKAEAGSVAETMTVGELFGSITKRKELAQPVEELAEDG